MDVGQDPVEGPPGVGCRDPQGLLRWGWGRVGRAGSEITTINDKLDNLLGLVLDRFFATEGTEQNSDLMSRCLSCLSMG